MAKYARVANDDIKTAVYVSKNQGEELSGLGSSGSLTVGSTGIESHGISSSSSATDPGIVLVTGASGFIATHVVQLLMRNGYRVRGTVRNLTNNVKVRPLLNIFPQSRYPLELIEADLNDPESLDRAVKGCRYVLHLAAQVSTGVAEQSDDLAKLTVNSTLAILRSCHKYRVKRVVYTSSIGAVYGDFGTKDPPDMVYTENCWTRIETAEDSYIRAKTLSERAAWNLWAELPEHERFELAVVNPAGVFGPVLCGVPGITSELLTRMLKGEVLLVPTASLPIVDVRDVALGHFRAMTLPQAAGRRIILFSGMNLWMEDIARIVDKEFQPQGYDISTKRCPRIILKIISLYYKPFASLLPTCDRIQHIDNSLMRSILDITPRPPDQTMIDMAYSLIEGGFVKKTRKYRGPPSDT